MLRAVCGNLNVRQATSQQLFSVTTFCMDTRFQSLSPLISRIVHHALLKISLCLNKPLQQLVRIVRIGTFTYTLLLMPQMLSSTGFRSQLLAAHMPGLMKLCFIALDCVTSAMCWCIVLVKDNHVPDAAYCWQQLWCQQHV